ncbi:endonuclease domain-containing protein [Mycobacterium colombiense]
MLSRGCYVCGAPRDRNGRALRIDHDHTCCPGRFGCGECVRGVLCNLHNIQAGYLQHPDRDAVQRYLNEWESTRLANTPRT